MGQYYKPTVLKQSWRKNEKPIAAALLCYDYKDEDDFGYGAKLMEHSYVLNDMVIDAVALLGTKYKGYPFVWVGDYADNKRVNGKLVSIYHEAGRFIYKDWDGDNDGFSTAYLRMKKELKWYRHDFKYLVNYDKKQYCVIPEAKEDEYVIHPLPLLTCAGNGLGGGDYTLKNDHYDYEKDKRIGSWAYNRIGATSDRKELIGFKEISGEFELDW